VGYLKQNLYMHYFTHNYMFLLPALVL